MSDASPTATERLHAMSAYVSVFTCLPIVLWPGLYKGTPFVERHASFALHWYAWMVALFLVSGLVAVFTAGLGALAMPVAFVPWLPATIGALAAALGFYPPIWLVTLATWTWWIVRSFMGRGGRR